MMRRMFDEISDPARVALLREGIRHAPTGLVCKSALQDFDKDALRAVCIDDP
jgi:hypothetical protein